MSRRRRLAALAAAIALGLLALSVAGPLATGADTVRAPRAFTVKLLSRNGSDMTGTARFVPQGKRRFVVIVTVTGGPGGSYPAHVHRGPCSIEPTYSNPRIEDGLYNVNRGRSRTTLYHSLATFRRGKYSLNVHDPTPAGTVLACGDLPRRF